MVHKLDARAPVLADCPADHSIDFTFGKGLPDPWGKFFHPTENGHLVIPFLALDNAIDLREQILGVHNPCCVAKDEFMC